MKRFRILPVAVALVLMVAAVGCTTVREADGEYYERVSSTPGRVYVDDPYRGTVILERDPYTGRYYEVNRYGTYYGSRYRTYDPYYDGRNSYPGNYPRNNRTYRTPYKFYVGEKFSHCGVNSFQLVKIRGEWKIQYIIDTRRRQNCD